MYGSMIRKVDFIKVDGQQTTFKGPQHKINIFGIKMSYINEYFE